MELPQESNGLKQKSDSGAASLNQQKGSGTQSTVPESLHTLVLWIPRGPSEPQKVCGHIREDVPAVRLSDRLQALVCKDS